jgi:antirestriction protein ArdC
MKPAAHDDIRDCYQRITDRIVAELETGTRPWLKPWAAGNMDGRVTIPLRSTGEPYRGINVIVLWMTAAASGYGNPYWFTFKQALELGACVRKGEKGAMVVYANRITKTETDDKGEEVEREIPFMKGYTVFNADQIEGLPDRYRVPPTAPPQARIERIAHAEAFFDATGATVRHGGNRAFYSTVADFIQLPPFESFRDAESYTATKAHEFVHWTGHECRLVRDIHNRFGTEDYAKEELVAELGSAFLCADLGITPEVREDHAAYIATWLRALKDDERLIFRAAAHAQRAADHLRGYQPQATPEAGQIGTETQAPAAAAVAAGYGRPQPAALAL